jgi:hypothetical protein
MMDSDCFIETIRKVWIQKQGYLLLRPWPDCPSFVQLCTENDPNSSEQYGHISITFGNADSLKILAQALMIAADEMEANND